MEGGGWKQRDKSGAHSRSQTHDRYGWGGNFEGGERWLNSWCSVNFGGEGGRRLKDGPWLSGRMVPFSQPKNPGEEQWHTGGSRAPF